MSLTTSPRMSDINETATSFLDIPDDLTIPQFFLDTSHAARPDRGAEIPCLIEEDTGRNIYFDELRARTFGLANALSLRWRIGEGDVVCILSPNHIDYTVAIWAIHRLGATVTAAEPSFSTVEEIAHALKATNSSFIVVHPDFLKAAIAAARSADIPIYRIILFDAPSSSNIPASHPVLSNLIQDGLKLEAQFEEKRLNAGDAKSKVAFLSFSSGTSGLPKATAISHYALIANVIQRAVHNKVNEEYVQLDEQRFRPGDISAAVLPLFHIFGVTNIHFMLFCGMSTVVMPKFDFQGMLKSIVRHCITHLFLVPAQIVLLCKNPAVKKYDLSCVRFCLSGSGPLPTNLAQLLTTIFPNASICHSYGLTELGTTVSMTSVSQRMAIPGSSGLLLPGISTRVMTEDGCVAAPGEQGELWIKGPSMAMGYADDQTATLETFVDGWMRTGDLVYIKDDEVFVVDRLKEIFKVRGFQVSPAELECHILSHPDVADVCVVGVPDEYSGEVAMAFVVLHPDAAAQSRRDLKESRKAKMGIMKHVVDAKANYKWLSGGVEFVDTLPRTATGKLLRRQLRNQARESRAR
ncbi:phenylacetyl-CoA ligase [Obba rivulosa]|uniref:Phenylacetyl-CoA ligase n=1 Tax=Obba rivulosa TaxID=1052685 RepID=A0A8E2J527_9APHY|nr:phenylacetyl-CoA ligase [Obba rivulosa]